jgi:hypothetical protein
MMLEDKSWILALVRNGRLSTCMTSATDDVDRGSFMVRMEASGCVDACIGECCRDFTIL